MATYGRCPLRASQRLALLELIGTRGLRRVATSIRTNTSELDEVAAGRIAPTLTDRANIIRELLRARLIGRAVGDYSDQHGPTAKDPLENLGAAPGASRRAAGLAPQDRGQDL